MVVLLEILDLAWTILVGLRHGLLMPNRIN